MKLVLAALFLAPLVAFADFGEPSDEVTYLSWCDRNVVMQDGQGRSVRKADCTKSGQRCVQEERRAGGQRVSYAVCR